MYAYCRVQRRVGHSFLDPIDKNLSPVVDGPLAVERIPDDLHLYIVPNSSLVHGLNVENTLL